MSQTPYLPDLAPTDFFLLKKLKTPIKGKRFATIEVVEEKSKQEETKKRVSEILK